MKNILDHVHNSELIEDLRTEDWNNFNDEIYRKAKLGLINWIYNNNNIEFKGFVFNNSELVQTLGLFKSKINAQFNEEPSLCILNKRNINVFFEKLNDEKTQRLLKEIEFNNDVNYIISKAEEIGGYKEYTVRNRIDKL
jgi:hypothetical protein